MVYGFGFAQSDYYWFYISQICRLTLLGSWEWSPQKLWGVRLSFMGKNKSEKGKSVSVISRWTTQLSANSALFGGGGVWHTLFPPVWVRAYLPVLFDKCFPVLKSNRDLFIYHFEFSAAPSNLIQFGDCHVTEPRQLSFTMRNHSATDTVRFQWPDHPQVKFSPTVGHVHHGCSKDIAITFKADKPVTLQDQLVACKVNKVTFEQSVDQVGFLNIFLMSWLVWH